MSPLWTPLKAEKPCKSLIYKALYFNWVDQRSEISNFLELDLADLEGYINPKPT
jgi:hypothetical protein